MLCESEATLSLDDYELKMFFLVPLTNDALLLRICKNVLILLYLKEVFYSSSNTYVFIMELQQPEEDFLT